MEIKISRSTLKKLTLKFSLLFNLTSYTIIDFANIPNKLPVGKSTHSSFLGITAGTYTISPGPFFPLIAATNDDGHTWNYPRSTIDDLTMSVDPSFTFGLLRGAACTGVDYRICIALGSFCKNDDCSSQVPLVALGKNKVTDWTFPHSVFEDIVTKIDPNFARGFFINGNCVGEGKKALCVAAGLFTNPVQNPLLGLTTDGGTTWTYPKTIFQNLKQTIDPSYSSGLLESANCNKSTNSPICIASGNFCSGEPCTIQLPLLALSTNKGSTWTYPPAIFKNLNAVIDPDFRGGDLLSSSCTGHDNRSVCIAVGQFFKSDFNPHPLLALTKTAGATWSYPSFIYTDLPTLIGHDYVGGTFKSASCTGDNIKVRCIAAGFFYTTKGYKLPLVALTKDGGQTWTYPPFFYTKLKTTVDPNTRNAAFTSASCINKNKESICMTAGSYCPDKFCSHQFPLIAITTDGGKTWNYPPSVFKNLNTVVDPRLTRAFFSDISCSGTNKASFCIASGQYDTPNTTFPLVAISSDNGATWTYPTYIFQNLTTTINPNFISGLFNNASTAGRGGIKK